MHQARYQIDQAHLEFSVLEAGEQALLKCPLHSPHPLSCIRCVRGVGVAGLRGPPKAHWAHGPQEEAACMHLPHLAADTWYLSVAEVVFLLSC